MAKTIEEEWAGLNIAIQRLPEETNDAYQAFLNFAWLQNKDRCVETVAERCGFSVGTCRLWQMNHSWLDRASAVDAQRWLHEYKQREKLCEKENQRFAKENSHIKREVQKAAKKMLSVAVNLLETAEMAGKVVETGHVMTADGREVATHTKIEMKAKISDIPRLVDTAVKASRLVSDLPTEIIDVVPMETTPSELKKYSIEELREMQEKNRKEMLSKGIQVFDQAQ